MTFLAVETSTPLGSVALINENFCHEITWNKQESHSECLTKNAERLLSDKNMSLQQIDALAVSIGPGSFTGIRVGLSFVKSLAYSLDLPIFVANSLELLAAPALKQYENVLCMQSAFRNLVYVAQYKTIAGQVQEMFPPKAITVEESNDLLVQPTLVLGDAIEKMRDYLPTSFIQLAKFDGQYSPRPKSSFFANLVYENPAKSRFLAWNQVLPLYVRASEAEEKLRQGVIKPL